MKTTDHFRRTIQAYLGKRAASDELFAVSFQKPHKNINDCITYILNTVQKSGCNGFTDDEVFSMAVHYYDEESIEIGKEINCKVVVNHTVELTQEEREQAKVDALKRIENEAYAKIKQQSQRATPKKHEPQPQASLFDF